MHDRSEWERCGEGPRHLKGRSYKNLVEFRRPCKTCGTPFSIFVTPRIAEGIADTNSFALRNCDLHRRGSGNLELDTVRSRIALMSDEMQGLYTTERQLRDKLTVQDVEIAKLKHKSQKMPWEA